MKTRLVPPLTAEEAAALNVCFLRDITATIQKSADTTGLSAGVAVYTPVGAEESYYGVLPAEFFLIAQRRKWFWGTFAVCGAGSCSTLVFVAVCLINSDSPTVPAAFLPKQRKSLLSLATVWCWAHRMMVGTT